MSLGNGNIHQKGEIPEITKLPNGRIRVIRRFQKFTREDVDNSSLGSLMGDFGAQDTADEQIAGQGYTNCRLIEVEVDSRFNALSNAENPILVKTYETLTEYFVETTDPTVTFSESGLKEITKIYRAVSGTTNSNSIGTTTLASGEILATSSIKDNTAFAELTEVYRQSGILNVTVERDSDSQIVSVECVELTSTEVSTALDSLIGNHELTSDKTQNKDGFEVNIYVYKIDQLTTLETTSDDLNFVRKIELSASDFEFGTINSTNLTFDSDTYTLRKEEVNNTGLIKKRTRIFALYDSDSFPANTLFEIDKTYGIAIPVARQIVPSSTATGTISATEAIQIEPVDSFRSLSYKILASDVSSTYLPEQVWYEKRNVSIFPDELISAEIVGTESPVFVANYKEAPRVGLKAKITRKFSWGAPDNSLTVVSNNYQPQPFNKAIEVSVTRNSTSETGSSSINSSEGTSVSDSVSKNNTQSDSTGDSTSSSFSTSDGTTSGTSTNTTQSSGTNTGTSTNASSTSGTNNSNTSGTSSSNSNTTSNSTTNSNNSNNTSSNTNTSSNVSSNVNSNSGSNTSSNGTISSDGNSSSTRDISSDMVQDIGMMGTDTVDEGTSERVTRSKMDAVPSPSDPARNVKVEAIKSVTKFSKTNEGNNKTSGTSTTSNQTQSQSNTNSSSNNSGSSNNSSNSNSNGNSSSNGNNSSNGTSTVGSSSNVGSNGSSSGTSNSTSNGTSNSSVNSSSSSSGTNNSTGSSSNASQSSSNNSSSGSSTSSTNTISSTVSDSNSRSQSTSNNRSDSDSTSKSTSKSIISINVKSSLREEKTVSFGSTTVTIPATTPATIARGSYIEIERSSSHWKYNIWVEQIVEVLLPS